MDASFDVGHLFELNLIFDGHLDIWKFENLGAYVFHSRGESAELLGHAVAHRHPLVFQVLLRELVVRGAVGEVWVGWGEHAGDE